jgi:hypothetical protein
MTEVLLYFLVRTSCPNILITLKLEMNYIQINGLSLVGLG